MKRIKSEEDILTKRKIKVIAKSFYEKYINESNFNLLINGNCKETILIILNNLNPKVNESNLNLIYYEILGIGYKEQRNRRYKLF
jgi:hypothetical protein